MVADPLISIVTTVYNRARYLGAAMESVLAQDHGDFEYIVLDDGSVDDSLAVARSYANDPRVRVIANSRNLGDYANRNKGVELARGKYIKFVDSDDLVYPHCVGEMLAVAERYPEAGVVFSARERPPLRYPLQLTPAEVYRLHFTVGGVLHQGPLSALLRREAVLDVGGFPDGFMGDVACWLKLARKYPVVLMGGGLFWWRQHSGQLSETFRSASVTWAGHQVEGVRLQWGALSHPECPLAADERMIYQRWVERDYLGLMIHQGLCGRVRVFNALRRGCPFRLRSALAAVRSTAPPAMGGLLVKAATGPFGPVRKSGHGVNDGAGKRPGMSVLVPIVDGMAGIRETIESLLDQDDDDWELIIVADAGADEAGGLARQYADWARVRVVLNPVRLGRWATHNQCVGLARGKYLKFVYAGETLASCALRAFGWYAARFPQAGLIVSNSDERILMPRELAPVAVYQAEAAGLLSVMEGPSGVCYPRDTWIGAGGFDKDSPAAAAKLHLAIARSAPVVFIHGGLVSQRGGSAAMRITRPRGGGRTPAEAGVLLAALNDPACPLSEADRRIALTGLARGVQRAAWDRRWGRWIGGRRLGRMIYGNDPEFAVTSMLVGGGECFDRSLYPAGGVAERGTTW